MIFGHKSKNFVYSIPVFLFAQQKNCQSYANFAGILCDVPVQILLDSFVFYGNVRLILYAYVYYWGGNVCAFSDDLGNDLMYAFVLFVFIFILVFNS